MIQSVARAAALLKTLGGDTPRLGVTELAERVCLAKGTVHGLLRTLEEEGLVEQDPETGKYQLGMALFQLGGTVLENHPLRRRSVFWADALANRTRQSARVGVLHGDRVVVVHHVFRPDDTVQILEVGASIPWNACALGKAIVATLPAGERDPLLDRPHERLTGSTLVGRNALEPALADIPAAGLAVEDQEAIVGEAGLAAPVFHAGGRVAGALGVTGPAERLTAGRGAEALQAAVRECARGLSRDLGSRLRLPLGT
jgi:DNA-binding IclR family transcriptional regulator